MPKDITLFQKKSYSTNGSLKLNTVLSRNMDPYGPYSTVSL